MQLHSQERCNLSVAMFTGEINADLHFALLTSPLTLTMCSPVRRTASIFTSQTSERAIRHPCSAFFSKRFPKSWSSFSATVSLGVMAISENASLPLMFPSFPTAGTSRLRNLNFDISAMAENVTTKQDTTAATRKCSGVQCPLSPLNSTGEEKGIFGSLTPSAEMIPLRRTLHDPFTR